MAADQDVTETLATQVGDAICTVYQKQVVTFAKAWDIITSDQYQTAIYEYNNFKLFGLPNARGWKHENIIWVEMIQAVDAGVRELERRMLDKNKV